MYECRTPITASQLFVDTYNIAVGLFIIIRPFTRLERRRTKGKPSLLKKSSSSEWSLYQCRNKLMFHVS